MMDKFHIASMLENYAGSDALRMHMPGHKGLESYGFFADAIFPFDITELSFSDNLAHPESVIYNAERDLAKIVNAEKSYILTGGSTLGVIAMMYAASRFGKKIIINRASHKSVYNAIELLGLEPVFFEEFFSEGLPQNNFCELSAFENLSEDCVGALLTSPDYFGRSAQLEKISEILHSQGKILLVDGAHGGHLSVLNKNVHASRYADAWVDGAHKTLPALTQGALLSVNNTSLCMGIERALDIFSTSSPSYPIMASVEFSFKYLYNNTTTLAKQAADVYSYLEEQIKQLGLGVLKTDDHLKLTVDAMGYDAYVMAKKLEELSVFPEMNDGRYILFMLPLKWGTKQPSALVEALKECLNGAEKAPVNNIEMRLPQRDMPYCDAIKGQFELVDIACCLGRTAASNVGIFPPCYPVVVAGEVFDNRAIDLLSHGSVFGLENGKAKVALK